VLGYRKSSGQQALAAAAKPESLGAFGGSDDSDDEGPAWAALAPIRGRDEARIRAAARQVRICSEHHTCLSHFCRATAQHTGACASVGPNSLIRLDGLRIAGAQQ